MARIDIRNLDEWFQLARNCGYSASALTRQLKVSRRQLQRYTRAAFGESPQRWLDKQRLIVAARLLKEQRSVKTVSYALGYKQASHFSREFKAHYGVSPTAFLSRGHAEPNHDSNGEPPDN